MLFAVGGGPWAVGRGPAEDGQHMAASNAAGSVGLDADGLKWARKGGLVSVEHLVGRVRAKTGIDAVWGPAT